MKDAYTKSSNDILEELSSKKDGLNEKEVTKRLDEYGFNEIEAKKPKTILEMVIDGLKDKMILILLSEKLYILYFVKASASFVFASSGPNAL